jgi:hypothetical protein
MAQPRLDQSVEGNRRKTCPLCLAFHLHQLSSRIHLLLLQEPPFFLGCSVALALRYALKSARSDNGITALQEFRLPMTSERLRLACGDHLLKKGSVEAKEGQKGFFVHI